MPKFLAEKIGRIFFRLARHWLLNRSDRYIARSFRVARRLIYAASGSIFLRDVIGEFISIFEEGGWMTETVRKVMREADVDYGAAILASIIRKD
jgi:hypothetical protein